MASGTLRRERAAATATTGTRRAPWRRVLLHLLMAAGALAMIYPLLWMVSSSFKSSQLIFTDLNVIPREVTGVNYLRGWQGVQYVFGHYILNSFLVSGLAVTGNLIACSMAAYAFARLQFRFKPLWFALMLGTIMLPQHVTIVPQYVLFQRLGWVNTYLPLTVPHFLAVDAFFVFLLVQFMRGLPRELDAAAAMDGAGPIRIYFSIILPLTRPALVTAAIFTFIWTWDEFFSAIIYLNDVEKFTVPLALRLFVDGTSESSWGQLFAMSNVALLPVVLLFALFQRLIVEGISTTGLKG